MDEDLPNTDVSKASADHQQCRVTGHEFISLSMVYTALAGPGQYCLLGY